MPTVLLIDDNAGVIDALALLLSLHDIDTLRAFTPSSGLALLADSTVDMVIQDMNFSADTTSGAEGETLFREIRALYPDMPVVLLTAWTHLSTAVELVRAGAADYQAKPWDDRKLVATVRNLLELGEANRAMTRSRESDRSLRRALKAFDLRGYLFADAATARAVHLACQVARADVPVLITGPNGAGKEGIASIVQANSGVCAGPFTQGDVHRLHEAGVVELTSGQIDGHPLPSLSGRRRRAGQTDHVVADLGNQVRRFGDAYEVGGLNQAALGVAPA